MREVEEFVSSPQNAIDRPHICRRCGDPSTTNALHRSALFRFSFSSLYLPRSYNAWM